MRFGRRVNAGFYTKGLKARAKIKRDIERGDKVWTPHFHHPVRVVHRRGDEVHIRVPHKTDGEHAVMVLHRSECKHTE